MNNILIDPWFDIIEYDMIVRVVLIGLLGLMLFIFIFDWGFVIGDEGVEVWLGFYFV
jgi:hypothetical protein